MMRFESVILLGFATTTTVILISFIVYSVLIAPIMASDPQFAIGSPVPCSNYIAMESNHSWYGPDYKIHTTYNGTDGVSYVLNDERLVIDLNRTLYPTIGNCIGRHCALRGFRYENVSPDPSVDNLCRVIP